VISPAPCGLQDRRKGIFAKRSKVSAAAGASKEEKTPDALYVCLQDEDKIAAFALDADTGQLTRQAEVAASGGPSVLAVSPDRRVLYVGHRSVPAISSFRINQETGALTPHGTVLPKHAPTFLATDRAGGFLLSAYYQGGLCDGPSPRGGRRSRRPADRPAGHGDWGPGHTNRPIQPVCLRAAHRPSQR
jgi:Lactonase, 7-bladed beta-propeller